MINILLKASLAFLINVPIEGREEPFGSNLSMWKCDLGMFEETQQAVEENDQGRIYGLF